MKTSPLLPYFPIIPLLVFAYLSIGSGIHESATYDEPGHLASGYRYWVSGKYDLDLAHPPLLRLWASIPLLFEHLDAPDMLQTAAKGKSEICARWLYRNKVSAITILNSARIAICFWGVFLGGLIWLWTTKVFGPLAACVAVTLYSFNPALLANTPLITTDMGAVVFSVLSLYLFREFWLHPTRRMSALAGLGFGLAFSAKFSAILLLPIFGTVVIVLSWINPTDRKRLTVDFFIRVFYAALTAAFVVLLFYHVTEWKRIPSGVWEVTIAHSLHPHYFAGHLYKGSPKWFLLANFMLKTPVPFMALLLVSWIHLGRISGPKKQFILIWLLLPSALYLALGSMSTFQSGIRRILILYPLLSMAIGGAVAEAWSLPGVHRRIVAILGLWYVVGTTLVYPNYLAYANELVGGPSHGHKYFLDCNLDWGQGYGALARYLKDTGVNRIYLCPFGSVDPHAYGIQYVPLSPVTSFDLVADRIDFSREKVQILAISATNREGLYYNDPNAFGWLKSRRPLALLADSIWVYDVTGDSDAHRHFAQALREEGLNSLADTELALVSSQLLSASE